MPKPLPTTNKRNDGYVGILFFTALLMGGGILMMYFENEEYQFDHEVKAAAPQKVSSLQKMKAAAPEAPPAAPPADAPQSRRVPVLPPVVLAPAAPVASIPASPPILPAEVSPMPRAVDASAPLVKPDAPPVEAGPPVLQPGFTLPRRR